MLSLRTQKTGIGNMDRNAIIGLLLIAGIVITFGILNAPSKEEIEKAKAAAEKQAAEKALSDTLPRFEIRDSLQAQQPPLLVDLEKVAQDSAEQAKLDSLRQIHLASTHGVFARAASGSEEEAVLENDKIKVTFSNKGARVASVLLKEYKTYFQEPLYLFHKDSSLFDISFFTADNKDIHTADLYFNRLTENTISVQEKDSFSMVFRLESDRPDTYIEFIYTLKSDDYLLGFDVRMKGMQEIVSSRSDLCLINWQMRTPDQEKAVKSQQDNSTVYFKYKDEDADYINEMRDEKLPLVGSIKWVAFKQQFFSSVLIANNYFDKTDAFVESSTPKNSRYIKEMKSNVSFPYTYQPDETYAMQFYFGPNHFQTLKKYELGLEKLIPLGWGILGWVNRFLVIPVFNFLDDLHLNYGIIILLLTIFIKLLLSPITYRNFISSAKMKVLKPEIAELNEKHKDDAMKKQQAVMELYRRAGVNPFAGCIPVILQMPILIALFRFFPASIELRQQSFLWADDLSSYDSILNLPFEIPFYGDHVSLFTILMAISIFFYSKATGQLDTTSKDPMAVQMRLMMYIMPFMMLFFFNGYSSGLSYYYLVANLITIGQTWAIRKWVINEAAIHKQIQENKKKPVKKSAFQQKLEEMSRQRSGKKK